MRDGAHLVGCCSTAVSLFVLFGSSLVNTFHDPERARVALFWMGNQLPKLADRQMAGAFAYLALPPWLTDQISRLHQNLLRQTGGALATSIETVVDSLLPYRTETVSTAGPAAEEALATRTSVPAQPGLSAEGRQNAPPPSDAGIKPSLQSASRIAVAFAFDGPNSPPFLTLSQTDGGPAVTGLVIRGKNTSDQPLMEVQSVLKPHTDTGEMTVRLSLEAGATIDQGPSRIPPGAEFSLVYKFPQPISVKMFLKAFAGGAIFNFHYIHANIEKMFICYFSASRFKSELEGIDRSPAAPGSASRSAGAPA
jgi:hypothetical protein